MVSDNTTYNVKSVFSNPLSVISWDKKEVSHKEDWMSAFFLQSVQLQWPEDSYKFVTGDDLSKYDPMTDEEMRDVETGVSEYRACLPDSTDMRDIQFSNEAFEGYLDEQTNSFLTDLYRTDFEDGYNNAITQTFEKLVEKNQYVTLAWFYKLFSNHQTERWVVSGLLSILAQASVKVDIDMYLPIVRCGLSDRSTQTHEAAIMVIENWRTQNCLDALLATTYATDWLRLYAEKVIKELREELQC